MSLKTSVMSLKTEKMSLETEKMSLENGIYNNALVVSLGYPYKISELLKNKLVGW